MLVRGNRAGKSLATQHSMLSVGHDSAELKEGVPRLRESKAGSEKNRGLQYAKMKRQLSFQFYENEQLTEEWAVMITSYHNFIS